jgi:hypothetical protein
VLARERQRVERDELLRERRGRLAKALNRIDAAPGRDLLVDRVEPMGAGDDRRARGRWEPQLDRAPDFEELGGEQDIERSRYRVEREDRRALVGGLAIGGELDVVARRSGPLGDAGNRRAVNRVAVRDGRIHDPIEEHAAPLPADGRDQETQQPAVGHGVTAASRRMTAARARLMNRVQREGFAISLTS